MTTERPALQPEASKQRAAIPSLVRRDVTVTGLVGAAHFFSHFYQIALAPLFPLLRDEFGVGYTALGVIVTVFFTASGISQAFVGILVDRFGARRLLVLGWAVLAGATALAGFASTYWMLLALALLAGLGNSVFHPADFTILTSRVGAGRLGRAYSVHAFCGTMGYAVSPVVVGGLAAVLDWRTALVAVGLVGLGAALAVSRSGELLGIGRVAAGGAESERSRAAPRPGHSYAQLIAMPAIVLAFLYFALTAMGGAGLQTFSVTALIEIFGVELALATGALSAYMAASAAGMLAGGVLADRTARHHVVAMAGMSAAASLMVALAAFHMSYALAMACFVGAGLAVGLTGPSRDMIVRAATPPGSTGKVFGFVYSGLDAGSLVAPPVFGWILDRGMPDMMFVAVAVFLTLAIGTVAQVRRRTAVARAT
ncbi:MAG: MFS transporter [Alphaproteobacteria bacterium]